MVHTVWARASSSSLLKNGEFAVHIRDAVAVMLLGFGMVTGCASPEAHTGDSSAVSQKGEAIESDAVTLMVRGMSCPKCADNIDLQLRSVRGVKDVAIDLGSGEVMVKFDPLVHPTRGDLERAIERTGFTLVSVEAREI